MLRPSEPPGMDETERHAWDHWAELCLEARTLTEQDGHALRDLACADVRVVRARREAKKHGMVQVDRESGTSKQSGWARELDAARADFGRLCAVFGVTPSDRSRVKAAPKKSSEKTAREIAKEIYFGTGE